MAMAIITALPHAARQPVRIFIEPPFGRGDADLAEDFQRTSAGDAGLTPLWVWITSMIWSPIVKAG
jgi:hypothetical protein